ncbi:MAG: hypothetical protein QW540_05675 [Archaeoglobaceae archaeon]
MTTKIIFYFVLLSLFIPFADAVEISTNAKFIGDTYYIIRGEKVDITISGNPSEEILVSIYYTFTLKSSGGQYYFSQEKFPIPLSSSFEVKAYPVKNLTVEAKIWIFKKKLSAEAKNGVAIVKADVPAGKYDVKFYGVASESYVTIESLATSKVNLDDKGKFSISYDTSYLPEGEMSVRVGLKNLKVKIVSSPLTTPTPSQFNQTTPALNETENQLSVEIEPNEALLKINETLELKIKVKDSKIGSLYGLKVLWSVNSSIIEIVGFEKETNLFGEAKATVKATSSGVAAIRVEIPYLNLSAVAIIYVQDESSDILNNSETVDNSNTSRPTPSETVKTTPKPLDTPASNQQKKFPIPGFDILTAFASIAILIIARKLGNR